MNNWLSTIFIQYVEKYRALDECQKEKIKYSFCTIIGEIEKIVMQILHVQYIGQIFMVELIHKPIVLWRTIMV